MSSSKTISCFGVPEEIATPTNAYGIVIALKQGSWKRGTGVLIKGNLSHQSHIRPSEFISSLIEERGSFMF